MSTECPHCNNKIGFVFGTCSECGFNYIDKTFHRVEVIVDDLPYEYRHTLVSLHAERMRGLYKD